MYEHWYDKAEREKEEREDSRILGKIEIPNPLANYPTSELVAELARRYPPTTPAQGDSKPA